MVSTAIHQAASLPEQPIFIVGQKHPLRDDVVTCEVGFGKTIAEIMGDPAPHIFVYLEGRFVPRHEWRYIRPKSGTHIEIKMTASDGDGGGNKFLRTVLMIVVAAAAMATGQYYAVNGVWGFAATAAAGAISAIGAMLVNGLVPPQMPEPPVTSVGQSSFNRKFALTGTRNQMLPYGVVPRLYGKHRFYPPFAARPFTEVIGEDQYVRLLLCLGYGPMDISDIRIGQTSIAEYDDVEYEIGESPALFANDVSEENFQIVYSGNADIGTANVRTSGIEADELAIDFVFPQGLFVIHDEGIGALGEPLGGKTFAANVEIKVEYRAAGSADPWLNVRDASGLQYVTGVASGVGWLGPKSGDATLMWMGGAERETRRCGLRWKVPSGQYDVRVTKVAHGHTGTVTSDEQKYREFVWTTLRTFTYQLPFNMPGVQLMAVRIKATDQLSGVVDTINMIAEAHLPVWDGVNWVPQKTRDPAWAYVDALCGPACKKPKNRDTQIDREAFKAWADDNFAKGRYFDAVIDAATTPRALMRDIAACGRATPTNKVGKESIVRDIAQAVPVQLFTPRNSWGFSGSKHFYEPLHAVRVAWTNPVIDWQQDEIVVYADGYDLNTATEIGEIQTRGVTDYTQAWRAGRYYLAVSEQRRESFSFFADFENLRCSKGALVRVMHDVINVGLKAARVKSVTVNGLDEATGVTLDETVEMIAGRNYALVVRRNDGTQQVQAVNTVAGETNTLTFTAAVPGVHEGDLVTFGYAGQETIDVIVKDIRRGADSSAQLFVLPAAPEIFNIDSEVPPVHTPTSSNVIDPALVRCCPPLLEDPGTGPGSIRSGDNAARNATGGIRINGVILRLNHQFEP